MLSVLTLFALSFVGSVVWINPTEGWAMYYGGTLGWNPIAVGLTCTLGQNTMYVLLYFGGERLILRWHWLGRKVERVYRRWSHFFGRGYLPLTAVGGVLGIPPVVAMVALASGFGFRLWSVLSVTLAARFTRFWILAQFGDALFKWWTTG